MLDEKQLTGVQTKGSGPVFFFDLWDLISLLLAGESSKYYTSMANIVTWPAELYYSHSWGSSVQTCGYDFAQYYGGHPIFPSDVVDYRSSASNAVSAALTGQITFFGRDRHPDSPTQGQVLCKIKPIELITLEGVDRWVLVDDNTQLVPEGDIFRP